MHAHSKKGLKITTPSTMGIKELTNQVESFLHKPQHRPSGVVPIARKELDLDKGIIQG
jgi:hypothetical protein